MKKPVKLPNGEIVVAHTLSKGELKTIPEKERKCDKWYWTRTPSVSNNVWYVDSDGGFRYDISSSYDYGGARLGFKNPFAD